MMYRSDGVGPSTLLIRGSIRDNVAMVIFSLGTGNAVHF